MSMKRATFRLTDKVAKDLFGKLILELNTCVKISYYSDALWLRLSANAYNTISDFDIVTQKVKSVL